jgi:hypothetical protein
MKKYLVPLLIAGFIPLCFVACGKKPKSKESIVSVEKNSFKEVTAHLDPGGDMYLYMGTERLLQGLSRDISQLRELAFSFLPQEENRANIDKGFNLVTQLVQKSGVEEISGLGMSAISHEKGLYHTKAMLHHYKEQNKGYLWSVFGKEPHTLQGLNLLPSTTALAMFADMDLPLFWSAIQTEVSNSGLPEGTQLLKLLTQGFEQNTGISWDQFLGSLGGEMGIVLTLDENNKISLPQVSPNPIPEPALLIVVKAKDDTVFNRLEVFMTASRELIKVDESGFKMRSMPIPLPLPLKIRATIARNGDYLFISTSDTLVREAVDVSAGKKKGIRETEEFKRLAFRLPETGNGFSFVSAKFSNLLSELQASSLQKSHANSDWMKRYTSFNTYGLSVMSNTDEGWLFLSNSNADPTRALMIQATVVPVGIMAAIAVPSFIRARSRAQATTVLNEVRQVDAAKDQFALENAKQGDYEPTWAELTPYLKAGSKLAVSNGTDSLGNPFTLGKIAESVRVHPSTQNALGQSTGGTSFWGPYS